VQIGSLTPFARLIPDLPAYAIFDSNGFMRVSFHSTAQAPFQASDFIPADSMAIRNGATTTLVEANRDTLVFAPTSSSSGWQIWNPASSQFDPLSAPRPCVDRAYGAGLALWSRHRSLAWTPGKLDAALPDLVKDTRTAGLLIPEAAFIVLETQSQEVMLARKERQSLGANHALEFDEAKTEKAPAPSVLWLILPALWLLWRMKGRGTPLVNRG
jgi:hypothetical protein